MNRGTTYKAVQKEMTAEGLYGTALYGTAGGDIYGTATKVLRSEIYAPAKNVLSQDIYGNSPAPPVQDLYGTALPGLEIYGSVPPQESPCLSGGDNNQTKVNNVISTIIPQPSIMSPTVPLETTLSSVFVSLSSTKLNDPGDPAPPSSNKVPRSTAPTIVIPQPSKFTPIINKSKVSPTIKIDTTDSEVNTTAAGFSPGSTLPPTRTSEVPSHPVPHSSINLDSAPETRIQSFRTPSVTSARKTDSNLPSVPIIRRTISRKSVQHHPNVPRHSINFTVSNNTPSAHHKTPPQVITEPVAHQPSFPTPSLPNKRSRSPTV